MQLLGRFEDSNESLKKLILYSANGQNKIFLKIFFTTIKKKKRHIFIP